MYLKLIRQVATPCDAQTGLSESQEVRHSNLDKTLLGDMAQEIFKPNSNIEKPSQNTI